MNVKKVIYKRRGKRASISDPRAATVKDGEMGKVRKLRPWKNSFFFSVVDVRESRVLAFEVVPARTKAPMWKRLRDGKHRLRPDLDPTHLAGLPRPELV